MNLLPAIARAVIVAVLAVIAARQVQRLRWWPATLACFLVPAILVGYAYGHFTLALVNHPGWNEVLYATLLWFKLTPLAAVLLALAPRSVSPMGLHCFRMLQPSHPLTPTLSPSTGERETNSIPSPRLRGSRVGRDAAVVCGNGQGEGKSFAGRAIIFALKSGAWRPHIAAGVLVALLAFQEFELAAFLGVKTWTVGLFDAHAGGLPVRDSIRLALPALLVELALLATLLLTQRGAVAPAARLEKPAHPLAGIFAGLSLVVLILVPAAIVLRGAVSGTPVLLENFALRRELTASLVFGTGAAVVAFALAGWRRGALWLCVPGLLGTLVLALAVVPVAWPVRETILPLLLVLALWLMPAAVVLRRVLTQTEGPALHLARQVGRAGLIWHLHTRRQWWIGLVLFGAAYFELTASAILAPTALTPATVRLYNLMHYGQTAVLSAMLLAVVLAPVILGAMAYRVGKKCSGNLKTFP